MHFLSFISILGWTLFLCMKYKKYASFSPFFVISVLILVLYLGGLTGLLLIFSRTVFFLGIILPIYLILIRKLTWAEFKKMPISFFFLAISGLIWFFFTRQAIIFGSDEFAWGQFTKVIFSTNGLYTANSAIMDGKLNYPPGISLFQYYFMSLGQYSEAAIFFSQGVFVLAAIAPIFDFVGKSVKKLLIFGLAVGAVLVYFGPGLLSMMNDQIIGVAFANALISNFFILRSKGSKLLLIPLIFSLPLMKTTGLILSLTIVLAVLIDLLISNVELIKEKKPKGGIRVKLALVVIALGIASLLPVKSWNHYIMGQGMAANPTPGWSMIKKSFSAEATDREKRTIESFNLALLERPINNQEGDIKADNIIFRTYLKLVGMTNRPGLSVLGWLLVFTLLFGLIAYCQKPQARIFSFAQYFSLLIGLLIYLFFHLLAYMYYFSEYEGVNLASMDRYVSSYFLGLALVTLSLAAILLRDNPKNKLFKLGFGLVFIYLLIFHTPAFGRLVIPPSLMAKSTTLVRDETRPFSAEINANTEENSKIWLIYQNTKGWECMMVRYDIVPRKMNGGGGVIGP